MRAIALIAHTGKQQAVALATKLLPVLQQANIKVRMDKPTAQAVGHGELGVSSEHLALTDIAIVLGGDGTLLNAAHLFSAAGVPILGVNLGHLGFLTEIEPNELDWALPRLLNGEYHVDERMMIDIQVWQNGQCLEEFRALNDAVISRSAFARLVTLEALAGDSLLGTYVGDGLIIATPAGSTAYSLSAGGPIVHPGISGILVTPICPHTLGARAVVVRAEDTVRVLVKSQVVPEELVLTIDGRPGMRLGSSHEIRVFRSEISARLIRLSGRSFYDVLALRLRN